MSSEAAVSKQGTCMSKFQFFQNDFAIVDISFVEGGGKMAFIHHPLIRPSAITLSSAPDMFLIHFSFPVD